IYRTADVAGRRVVEDQPIGLLVTVDQEPRWQLGRGQVPEREQIVLKSGDNTAQLSATPDDDVVAALSKQVAPDDPAADLDLVVAGAQARVDVHPAALHGETVVAAAQIDPAAERARAAIGEDV